MLQPTLGEMKVERTALAQFSRSPFIIHQCRRGREMTFKNLSPPVRFFPCGSGL